MPNPLTTGNRYRKNFGRIKPVAKIPNLIKIQSESYTGGFLQLNIPKKERKNLGLQNVLNSIFPVKESSGRAIIDFVEYDFDTPKFDVEECIQRGLSYVAGLKVTLRLSVWDIDETTGAKEIKGIKEQEVYMGDVPFMTKNGTFVINGTERVVVSQMHRSPGGFFYHDEGKTHSSGKFLYSARIIPYRGSWLDFEFDGKDSVFFRIDRKRKLPVSTLLLAIGMSLAEIYDTYYEKELYELSDSGWIKSFNPKEVSVQRLSSNLVNAENNEVVLEAGQKITPRLARKFADNGLKKVLIQDDQIIDRYSSQEILDQASGEILVNIGDQITQDIINAIKSAEISQLSVLKISAQSNAYMRNTIKLDKNQDYESALVDIFRVLRPGEPPTVEAGKELMSINIFTIDLISSCDKQVLSFSTSTFNLELLVG